MMRAFPTTTALAAAILTGAPALACPPPPSTTPGCTEPLTIVNEGDGFTIMPRSAQLARQSEAMVRLGLPHRLGASVWLDADLIDSADNAPLPIAFPASRKEAGQ